jgi:hypothetical protein
MFRFIREVFRGLDKAIDGIIDPHDPQSEARDMLDHRIDLANAFIGGLCNAERANGVKGFDMLAAAGDWRNETARAHVFDAISTELGLPVLPVEIKRAFGSASVKKPGQLLPEKTVFFLLGDPDAEDATQAVYVAAAVCGWGPKAVFTRLSYDAALDDGQVAVQVLAAAAEKPTVDMTCH